MAEIAGPLPRGRRRTNRRSQPGLFDLYLIRGALGPLLLIFFCVSTAMMLERGLRLIHELAASGADVRYFFPLLLRLFPYYLDLAIPASFMVSLVLLVARLDDHLEFDAMMASGLSLARIAAPLAALGVALSIVSLVTGGWLEPLGGYSFRMLRAEAINAGKIGHLQPRGFYHPGDNVALTFDRSNAKDVEGIFVWQRSEDGGELVLTGSWGRIGFAPEAREFGIDLHGGRYVIQRPASEASDPYLVQYSNMEFRESLRLRESRWQRGWSQNELTLPELVAPPEGARSIPSHKLEAEFYSRLARVITLPLLPFLVLPLAFATKRGRRGLGVLLAVVLLVAFQHGLNLAKQVALTGNPNPLALIAGTTILFAAVIMLIFHAGRHLPASSPVAAALSRFAHAFVPLHRRGQAIPNAPGGTLALYISARLAAATLLALVAAVVLLQMVDIFDRGNDFVERGMGIGDVLQYAWLRLPPMLQQAVPITALSAAMIVFAGLSSSQEMIAMRAVGLSQWRILLMALPVPLLLALGSYLLAEYASPSSQVRFAEWWGAKQVAQASLEPEARWFRAGGEIVQVRGASADGSRLTRVEIFRRDARGLITERLSATSAAKDAAGWRLTDIRRSRYWAGRVEADHVDALRWNTPLQSRDVTAFFSSARSLSSAAAQRSLHETAPVNQGATWFATRLQRSLAEPLAPLLLLLLALPLAFASPRTGAVWPALLYAAGGGLLYLVADGVLTVMAQVGYVPAIVGAWTAPVVVLLTGTTVLLYSER